MQPTKNQVERAKQEFEAIAKEPLIVEYTSGTFYAFGSELAVLRLLRRYRDVRAADARYSSNRASFYFRLDLVGA